MAERDNSESITVRQLKEMMLRDGPISRKVGDERPWEELSEAEQQECLKATEAAKKAFLEEGGFHVLFHCGHCGEDWEPSEDEELFNCPIAGEEDGIPGHMVCWKCREEQVACPNPRAQ